MCTHVSLNEVHSQERHIDGGVSIVFPDGTTKTISPGGTENITFPDSTVVTVQARQFLWELDTNLLFVCWYQLIWKVTRTDVPTPFKTISLIGQCTGAGYFSFTYQLNNSRHMDNWISIGFLVPVEISWSGKREQNRQDAREGDWKLSSKTALPD